MKVVSVNIGKRRTVPWGKKMVETGIFKSPVDSITLGAEDVDNDNVVDRKYHGGIDKACYLYSADHYGFWKEKYPETVNDFGAMGENITIEGLDERQLHIGDTYQIGEAVIQISEHREPCYKLNVRLNSHNGIKDFIDLGHCGAYCRVLQPGSVKKGDKLITIQKSSSPTVFQVFELIYKKTEDLSLLHRTLDDPQITEGVKEELNRVWGLNKDQ